MRLLSEAVSTLLDFLYPPLCLACGGLLETSGSTVCTPCWNSIKRAGPGDPRVVETTHKLTAEGGIDDLISLFIFEKGGAFQQIAHAVKYQAYERLAFELGRRVGRTVMDVGVCADLIVPVPLHRVKWRERGYNQAEVIARGMSEVLDLPVVADAVCRTRYTQTQTRLTVDERRRNMAGAFGPKTPVAGACFLVDDVITTGATTLACAEALRQAGASRVIATAAALAQKDADLTER